MKTIFTFLLSLFVSVIFAQDEIFVHTATVGNIAAAVTYIDHPDLNGNPGAKVLVTHNWNPGGAGGVFNDKRTGVFYSNVENKWSVFYEDNTAMAVGTSYNVMIGGSATQLHIADLGNQGSIDSYSVISHPDLNGNPNANLMVTSYWNPSGIFNDHNYGVWYDDVAGRWNIYSEDGVTIPLDSAFFVASQESEVAVAKHIATAGNIAFNYTVIDHPLLNGDPNATFVIIHNWGVDGASENVVIDKAMGVWYTGTNWSIYIEDTSAMPQDAAWDLFIYDPSLGVEDTTIAGLTYFPNPVQSEINIKANTEISKVTVFDVLGRQVMEQSGDATAMKLNLSALTSGNYLAKVEAGNAVQVIKLIKL